MPLGELVLPKVKVSLYNPQGAGQPGDKTGKKTIDFRRRERPAVTKSGWGLYTGKGEKLPGVFSLQLSWVASCEVHKTK